MTIKAKKVTVLTGFLGSGKTTLLNAILQSKANTRFAIIENEVGEIGIDGELIVKNTDSFTEMSNGCICCSLNENFIDTLRALSQREDWDELIIEATGVANPAGIVTPFRQFPWLQKYFELPEVICIADALNIEEQLRVSDTGASQLAYGDKVYISKSDLVPEERIAEIRQIVKRFNPFTYLYAGSKENIPVEELLEKKDSLRPLIQIGGNKNTLNRPKLDHDQFDAISLEYNESFNENKLFARLYAFLVFQSANVYRFKGIFYDPRKDHKLVIQSVMKSIFIEEGEAWQEGEEKTSKFVFIGKGLKEKGFDKMLRDCVLKG